VDDLVERVREFNRFYTRVIGVLQEGLLRSPYTLSEVRVMYELAQRDVLEVADLRRTLDVDAGYLSRMLTRLVTDGIVTRERSAADARRQTVALTDRGRTVFAELDERSSADVAALVGRLDPADRRRLGGAMAAITDLLQDGSPRGPVVVLRGLLPGDLGWVVERHGALYAREHGWDETFEAMVARIMADYAAARAPGREAAWVAEVDGEPVGCIACMRDDDETARLRVLLVEPSARGTGLGSRLVEECLRFARPAGYRRIVLLTYDARADARRNYERAGFRLTDSHPTRAYGHEVVEQEWSLNL
jgi:DNA-binding MarR family transcriptional regulator/predicted N-acetyltransferase YhbS